MKLGSSGLETAPIALGCMRMKDLDKQEALRVIETSKEAGITLFDHADIYGAGSSEEIFAAGLKESAVKREDIILQSKCGIRDGFFDFSKQHILSSVDGILERLQTDYLDVLLLHRPDALMEPEEVADAFRQLKESGKVRHFGVSNHQPCHIDLLKQYVKEDLIINQLQFSLMHTPMLDAGLNLNMHNRESVMRDAGVLPYSQLNGMTVQAWSPFQFGMIEGVFIDNPAYPDVNKALQEVAESYNVSKSTIAIAWILRHPAGIQAVIGSMNPDRIHSISEAQNVKLSRKEWYSLYRAAGNNLP
ncbi:Predicted oxidoreductase [Terribacillus aidingensis]|uniref:Predicted oxidoreductase n=1 Tax=Terribacillus aidingensis TaxID=586416 RepID=A0A285P3B9_9BACI|nr:aldo/keto reductase [Terribacillus aidingensis]SNZ15747.1 Predicted oxidoreductase [Terribacillus aidingensis]